MVSLASTLGNGKFSKTGGWEDKSEEISAAISVSGAYDLVELDWGSGWLPPGEDWRAAREYASPINHVSSHNKPLLLLHSGDDHSVPVQQAVDMSEALKRNGGKHQFERYSNRGHMLVTEEVIEVALGFITKVSTGGM